MLVDQRRKVQAVFSLEFKKSSAEQNRCKLCSLHTQDGVETASEILPIDVQANVGNFFSIITSTQSELIA